MLPPEPVAAETQSEMEFYSLAESYQALVGTPAWMDIQNSLDLLADAAEEKALNLQPGAGETTRLEALIEWRQLRLTRHAITLRAESLIERLTERINAHGDPISDPERTRPDDFLPGY